MFSYFKRERPGHSHKLNKVKPNSDNVNNEMSNYLGFTQDFRGASKGLVSFLRLHLLQHTACLLGSSWVYSIVAVFGSHSTVPPSPKCWGLLWQLGYSFTNSLSLGSLYGGKPQLLCMTSSILGSQLLLRLHHL